MSQKRTRVVSISATKGGTGKTMITAALATRAAREFAKVAIIDSDEQQSLAKWRRERDRIPEGRRPPSPQISEIDCSSDEAVGMVYAEGWDWLFIDTPPGMMEVNVISDAIGIADIVLIPTGVTSVELEALGSTIRIAKETKKPFAFVINKVATGMERTAERAAEFLRSQGPVLNPHIAHRNAYARAMDSGLTGPEIPSGRACLEDIEQLWVALNSALAERSKRFK